MTRFAPRALLVSCIGICALAGAAAAEPAPIVYAGQGGVSDLAGGGENSYGYGAARPRAGAAIDLRRPSNGEPRVEPGETEPRAPIETQAEQGAWLERERVGPPYQANGSWYVPTPEPGYAQIGMASWYGPTFHGQRTASGEVFDQDALTAAHPTLPIPSLVQVTNLESGREIIVRVNDRGPFVGERLIDLSRRGAEVLGFEQTGQARVHVRYLGPAPRRVNADGAHAPVTDLSPTQEAADGEPASLLPPQADDQRRAEPAAYAPPPASAGSYFVQVGAFSDMANAQRVRDEVAEAGPVQVDVRQTRAGELFRVRVGPWVSREEADAARLDLASLGFGETIVAGP